jgi:acyl carrier protein
MIAMAGNVEKLMNEILKVPIEKIGDDMSMDNVPAWDSLKHMELIAGIEKNFSIELTFEEIIGMRSVAGIKKVLIARNQTV